MSDESRLSSSTLPAPSLGVGTRPPPEAPGQRQLGSSEEWASEDLSQDLGCLMGDRTTCELKLHPLTLERRWTMANGNPLQYSCLENHTDGGASLATVHGVAKSRTRLSDFTSLPSSLGDGTL